ncbi:MAG TPA: YncE family protein [Mucilaginibacter sp.]|jgi:DNA-binding beta-propeller fold protein YncE|nr:YncE family protein [Mucilaginibacter sp.]
MRRLFLLIILCLPATLLRAQHKLLVAVQQEKDSVAVFNLENNQRMAQLPVGYKPHEICYDPLSKKCFITDFGLEDYDHKSGKTGNGFHVIDPLTGRVIRKVYTTTDTATGNGPHGIKIRPGKARELFVNVEIGGDTMIVFDAAKLFIKRKFSLPKGAHNFSFSAKGDTLWLMAGQNGVFRIDPGDGRILSHNTFSSPIRGLAVGTNWIAASGLNEIFLLSKTDLSVLKHLENLGVGQLFYSNITTDQRYIIAPAALDNIVLVIDADNGKVVKRLNTGKTPINVQISGHYAYVSQDKDYAIGVIDLEGFRVIKGPGVFGTNGLTIIE